MKLEQGSVELFGVGGKVGKDLSRGEDGHMVRCAKICGEVTVRGVARRHHVAIGSVQIVKIQRHKPFWLPGRWRSSLGNSRGQRLLNRGLEFEMRNRLLL